MRCVADNLEVHESVNLTQKGCPRLSREFVGFHNGFLRPVIPVHVILEKQIKVNVSFVEDLSLSKDFMC